MLGAMLGAEVRVVSPEGYAPDAEVVARARALHPRGSEGIWIGQDPAEGVSGCNALYTDVWASMGQEDEARERARIFADYQLNAELLTHAEPGARIMHCLPAHRGSEITDEVIDSEASIVFDQAENRLHVQKAILVWLNDRMKKDNQN
jgi:ornithine carbamoyltransferase